MLRAGRHTPSLFTTPFHCNSVSHFVSPFHRVAALANVTEQAVITKQLHHSIANKELGKRRVPAGWQPGALVHFVTCTCALTFTATTAGYLLLVSLTHPGLIG